MGTIDSDSYIFWSKLTFLLILNNFSSNSVGVVDKYVEYHFCADIAICRDGKENKSNERIWSVVSLICPYMWGDMLASDMKGKLSIALWLAYFQPPILTGEHCRCQSVSLAEM